MGELLDVPNDAECLYMMKLSYGHALASQAWADHLDRVLRGIGKEGSGPDRLRGRRSPQDPSVYTFIEDGERVSCVVYVDDLCFSFPPDSKLMKKIDRQLRKKLKVGKATSLFEKGEKYLGVEVTRLEDGGVSLNQTEKIEQLYKDLTPEQNQLIMEDITPEQLLELKQKEIERKKIEAQKQN